jgi:hypothetical protein
VWYECIARLLTDRSDLMVSDAMYSDEVTFLHTLVAKKPDAVLVCGFVPLETTRILNLLASYPGTRGLRILVARLLNDEIAVYETSNLVSRGLRKPRQISVRSVDDLLETIL